MTVAPPWADSGVKDAPQAGGVTTSASSVTPVWDVAALLQGGSRAILNFQGESYRLSVTRLGKLILTK